MQRLLFNRRQSHALDRALEQAFLERTTVEEFRKMVAEGILERAGVSRAGNWFFCEPKAAATLPPGVISLMAKRRERVSRTNYARSRDHAH